MKFLKTNKKYLINIFEPDAVNLGGGQLTTGMVNRNTTQYSDNL